MSMGREFAALRWRIIRHGPHGERVFSLIAGLLAAAAVIVVAVLAVDGTLDRGWLTLAVSVVGLTWLIGPILLPGSAPLLDPGWFRTLPRRPVRIARELALSEAISVGTFVTAVALCSVVVLASGYGSLAVVLAVVAALAQLFFLLWLGRCSAAVVTWLLRSSAGMWVAALQMSALLAVSFAGWVPIAAAIIPDPASGETAVVNAPGAVPEMVETVLLTLPTGWSIASLEALISGASPLAAATPVLGLVLGGLLLRRVWIGLTAGILRRPPARTRNAVKARRSTDWPQDGGPVRAVLARELRTWFRDPHRLLGLGHAWMTPLLMVLIVALSGWPWALPFVGPMAAAIAAMVAVNTYALDGTALWQLLTTPGSVRSDVTGRQLAWMLLFGLPIIALTIVLCIASASPLSSAALGMAIAATGAACGAGPLFSALMPAIGLDARHRVSTADEAGNAAGGQYTVFTAVVAIALLPVLVVHFSGIAPAWAGHLALGTLLGVATPFALASLTSARVRDIGPALLSAIESRDPTRLQSPGPRRRSP